MHDISGFKPVRLSADYYERKIRRKRWLERVFYLAAILLFGSGLYLGIPLPKMTNVEFGIYMAIFLGGSYILFLIGNHFATRAGTLETKRRDVLRNQRLKKPDWSSS